MKRALLLTGVMILPLVSCNTSLIEENIEGPETGGEEIELVVKAVMGDDGDTKTAVQADGVSIYWTEDDAINLFYGATSSGKFTSTITEPAASADFYGTISVATGTTENSATAKSFWGVYPYNLANTCDGDGVVLTIPDEQSGVAGTFADKLNPTVAKSTGLDLAFYNVGSWFKFTVSASDIVSATFSGRSSESVVGTVRVEMENSRPVVTDVQNGATSITMTPEGGAFVPGEEYYMVLIPQIFADGYSLTLTKSNGATATWSTTGSKTFTRSSFRGKLNADSGLTFIKEGNIDFADANVKAICVAHWDTDGDGELSYTEAEAVTSIPYGVFSGNATITSFDEFQYFTGVSSLGYDSDYDEGMDYYGAFYHCTALQSIVLPPTLHVIPFACFRDCSALAEIVIPASVTTIQQIAFDGCPNLDVYMESETPCTLQKDIYGTFDEPYAFGSLLQMVKTIYVPTEEAVAVYKAAQYWSTYKWRIKWVGEALVLPTIEAVDLGLSVKWAPSNLCEDGLCANPEDYGDYYAWGEVEPYYSSLDPLTWKTGKTAGYSWASYKWCMGAGDSLTKYCNDSSKGYNGFTDSKTVLDPEDDVAHVKLGGNWRMPTDAEWTELRTQCTWSWTDNYNGTGVAGRIVTSKVAGYTDKSIFLPAAGYRYITSLSNVCSYGYYWSSSLYTGNSREAYCRLFSSDGVSRSFYSRRQGNSVRPVSE